jgi:hypothetical protein
MQLLPHPRRFRSRPLQVIALTCAVTLALGGTAIADAIFENSPPYAGQMRFYTVITAKHSELNLNVPEASTQNGTQIIQWKQPGAMNEQWELVGKAPALIRNRWSRQCLTVDSSAQGAPVVQRPCDGSTKQRWSWVWQPDGDDPRFANIRNQYSGLDLNVAGGSGAYGAKLIQWPHVAHTPNALFTFAAKETVD